MGGMFKASQAPATNAAPTPAVVDTAAEDRKRRLEALERQRAGRAGTITTSSRGLLMQADWVPERKSLLGE